MKRRSKMGKKFKKLMSKLWSNKVTNIIPRKFRAAAFGIVFGLIGVTVLLSVHAITPTASIEGENGTVSGPATVVNDTNASAGKAVKFNAASSGTWTLLYDNPLTSEPTGTTYSSGVRTTDSSYNRKAQVTYTASGMTITAEKISGTIYSADVLMKGFQMPNHHAIEADVTLNGYLGVGMFPAMWERPNAGGSGSGAGEGERDIWEYLGGSVGADNEWKQTNITTPYSSSGQPHQNQTVAKFAPALQTLLGTRYPLGVTLHWRSEFTQDTAIVTLNGTQMGKLTKAGYDASQNGGVTNYDYDMANFGYDRWLQFETTGKTWYPRFTYQIGNGANSSNAGAVPTSWTQSTMVVKNLKIYGLTSEQ